MLNGLAATDMGNERNAVIRFKDLIRGSNLIVYGYEYRILVQGKSGKTLFQIYHNVRDPFPLPNGYFNSIGLGQLALQPVKINGNDHRHAPFQRGKHCVSVDDE